MIFSIGIGFSFLFYFVSNCLDQQHNPYKPTYTFPDEFSGDSDHMEDYIRKTATHTIDRNNRSFSKLIIIVDFFSFFKGIIPMSTVRPLTSSLK